MKFVSSHACFGGTQHFLEHDSRECATPMRFAVYEPPQASARSKAPVIYYLAGLTCNEETFPIKAGAQRLAAEHGLMLVAPDTSPRVRLPGDDASWDFGLAASFYVDATREPWRKHYRMYSYVTRELPEVMRANFASADPQRQSIMGHSMGGHGALVCALRNPGQYRCVSAFAPISSPAQVPWGIKAFSGYLGDDRTGWAEYDANALVRKFPRPDEIVIDQGTSDRFLAEQLRPEMFAEACGQSGQRLQLRMREGYDHGYYFVETFMPGLIAWHAAALRS